MAEITIGSVAIGDGHPCRIIAEACDNHGGSPALAKEMAHAAKENGADIVKFQLHLPDEEMVREEMDRVTGKMFGDAYGTLYDAVAKIRITPEDHAELMSYCARIGIQYLCTPFSLKAAQLLAEMGAAGFKIGSGETEDLPFIEEVAAMGKPMIVSTGMTHPDELNVAVSAIRAAGAPLVLLHCISVYASHTPKLLNLSTISGLRERYDVPVGLSDHTSPDGILDEHGRRVTQSEEVFAAIAQGACTIEKHFTTDRLLPAPDNAFSIDPAALRDLVSAVRAAEACLQRRDGILDEERSVHVWAKRSVVAATDIPPGTVVTRAMITSKRPGTGIRSKDYRTLVLGKTAARHVPAGKMILPDDLR